MSGEKKDAENNSNYHITLKVCGPIEDKGAIFKIRKFAPMRLLMDDYCNRMGLDVTKIRFLFYGRPVLDSYTASYLDMQDGDLIDVFPMQYG